MLTGASDLNLSLLPKLPSISDVPDWGLPILSTTTVSVDACLRSALVGLEFGDLWTIHVLHNLVRLPFFEAEAKPFVRIILVVSLVLMILDLDEVRVDRCWIQ